MDALKFLTDMGLFIGQSPAFFALMKQLAQAADAPLSQALRDGMRQSLPAVNRKFRHSAEASRAFMKLLAATELSFAVPVSAVTYVLETVLAKYFLKEHVNWLRWAGASLVVCGVALVSL